MKGMNLEEAGLILAKIGKQGREASMASASIKDKILELTKTTPTTEKVLKEMGIEKIKL